MKYRAYFIAAGVALAAVLVTLAAAAFHGGRLHSLHLGEVTANPVAHQTAGNTYRVYCFNGIKGDQDHLYRAGSASPRTAPQRHTDPTLGRGGEKERGFPRESSRKLYTDGMIRASRSEPLGAGPTV